MECVDALASGTSLIGRFITKIAQSAQRFFNGHVLVTLLQRPNFGASKAFAILKERFLLACTAPLQERRDWVEQGFIEFHFKKESDIIKLLCHANC